MSYLFSPENNSKDNKHPWKYSITNENNRTLRFIIYNLNKTLPTNHFIQNFSFDDIECKLIYCYIEVDESRRFGFFFREK